MFHQAIVAYMSDYELLTAALKPHAMSYLSPGLISASLDHSLYFHRPFAADQWLKYSIESTISANARGMNSGQFAEWSACMQLYSRESDAYCHHK